MLSFALFICFAYHISAQQNTFFNPPNTQYGEIVHNYTLDKIWPLGSAQNITWSTSYTNSTLILWQNDNPDYETFIASGPSPGFYYWNPVTTKQNLAKGTVFFFQIQDLSGSGDPIGSHYFNLTAGTGTSTTSSIAATSTTASASALVNSATVTESVPDPAQTSSSGMSTSTKAGIGIGAGVGVPLVAAMALGFFLLGRRKRRRNRVPLAYYGDKYPPPGVGLQEMSGEPLYEMPAQYQGEELPGHGIRAELSASHG